MEILRNLRKYRLACAVGTGALALWAALGVRGSVVINEIHYHPDVTTEPVKFVELYNADTNAADLSGWYFSAGIGFVFPQGTQLAPEGHIVVAQDPAFLRAKYNAAALGPFTGSLSGNGEKITLRNAGGTVEDEVNFQLGFPWPTVGDAPGYSIELIDPALDNNLGGSWRASVRGGGGGASQSQILISPGSPWRYRKGTSEASTPRGAWRASDFDDSDWSSGSAPIGYDSSESIATRLDDMRGNYASFFARKMFVITNVATIGKLMADVKFDDGFNLWINGRHVLRQSMDSDDAAFDALSNTTRESGSYDTFELPAPWDYLVTGANVIAVQVHNVYLSSSSDAFIDLKLYADPKTSYASRGPTPGSRNSVHATNAPPQIRQVDHSPQSPSSGETVSITAKITDPHGVAGVTLHYQVVEPGNYIELGDAAFQTQWTSVLMKDDGTEGDAMAADDLYTAALPASLQVHRRLIRYRITAADSLGESISVPYADDPQPNFAYFVYDGVPAWKGAARPSVTPVMDFDTNVMRRLPVYHLISKKDTVERSTWRDHYQGEAYPYAGTVIYDGQVYDHIRFRTRGGVWRYAMGKNMWKFDMNRGHDFEPRDNFGKRYSTSWRKINLGACIQQGDYGHRGEQGLFESVGFKLFDLAGIEAPKTHFIQFRVIDQPEEASETDQYAGDFWGLYLAVEQEDGRFLSEHGLPDGNVYKMDGGTGTLNNQGPTAVTDRSDLNRFMSSYKGSPTESWWRTNLDLVRYYNYRTVVEAIHHYDIDEGAGKNYDYYLNPKTGLWSVHPWDLDLTWANNMYGGGVSPFKNRVLPQPSFNLEYRNRIREIRDLLFNADQTGALIDEFAAMIHDPSGAPSFSDADRAQWDYNPVMASSYVNSSKAGQGLFYRWPNEPNVSKDFHGAVQLMKNYVAARSSFLDSLSADAAIPGTPVVTAETAPHFPFNRLVFKTSRFAGNVGSFAALRWRLAEVTTNGAAPFNPLEPRKYEIAAAWESGESPQFDETITIPHQAVKIGHAYRVRACMKDTTGRWSHWSQPVQFVAGEPEDSQALVDHLRVTELMYDPSGGAEFEYIELYNSSDTIPLDLSGARFSNGIEFSFSPGTTLEPNRFLLLAKGDPTNHFAAFRAGYRLPDSVPITGPFLGNLDNKGETLTLLTGPGGTRIFSFTYGNGEEWPVAAAGKSLTRISLTQNTEDPRNWTASEPTPGIIAPAAPLRLELPHWQGNGQILLRASYLGSDALSVEFSTNLTNWSVWGVTNAHDGLFEFPITNLTSPEPGFFRLKK